MASGFVSGGTVDAPNERSDEWLAAQKEIEANRQRKLDEQAQLSSGKSLYETLEANKVAKQEAFEEANRLKNQFRPLDEDEVEYLDSVLESTRREEERVKRETAEGLKSFRQQQEEADKKARAEGSKDEKDDVGGEEESWNVAGAGKKRKRAKEKEVLRGVKIRRASTVEDKEKLDEKTSTPASTLNNEPVKPTKDPSTVTDVKIITDSTSRTAKPTTTSKSSLVAYGSDSEDD